MNPVPMKKRSAETKTSYVSLGWVKIEVPPVIVGFRRQAIEILLTH